MLDYNMEDSWHLKVTEAHFMQWVTTVSDQFGDIVEWCKRQVIAWIDRSLPSQLSSHPLDQIW